MADQIPIERHHLIARGAQFTGKTINKSWRNMLLMAKKEFGVVLQN